jgi:transglutaminase-like putative cysteine protease
MVLAVWLGLLGFFTYRQTTAAAETPGLATAVAATEDNDENAQEWFGIYIAMPNGEKTKIGYTVSKRTETSVGFQTDESTYMRLGKLGEEQVIRTESKILTGPDHKLQYIDLVTSSDKMKFKIIATVRGSDINLEIETAAGVQKQTLHLPEPPMMQDDIALLLVHEGGLHVGATADAPFFDPTTRRYEKAKVRVTQRLERPTPSGGKLVAYRVEVEVFGMTSVAIVDERGRMLEETMATFTLIREPRQTALTANWSAKPPDLPELAQVRVEKPIPNARDAKLVKVRLTGVKFDDLPLADDRQTFADGVLTVQVKPAPSKGAFKIPYRGDDAALWKFMKPEPLIESDDPAIVEQARKIVPEGADAVTAARAINDWIYKNLEKKAVVSITSAREVLLLRRGACNEHASLFTALARAAGLPAQTYAGLVYANGSFYYHAWNGVYVGEWVAVDSTLDQYPADATHLRIVNGGLDKQVDILRMIGAVKIDALEAK